MNCVNVCFVFLFVYLIPNLTSSAEHGIVCDTGHHATSKVSVNYTISKVEGLIFGCMDGLSSVERSYPGSPESLTYTISTINTSFSLLWKPPDDSSTEHVTGFLVEMYIEEMGNTHSFGPSACYLIDSKLVSSLSAGKFTQDVVFHLNCRMKDPLNVYISVKSLPVPVKRKYKEASINVTFQGTVTKRTTPLPSQELGWTHVEPETEKKTTSVLTISLAVFLICVISMSTVFFIVFKNRSHGYGITNMDNHQHDSVIVEEHYHQVLDHSTSANSSGGTYRTDRRPEYCVSNISNDIDISHNCKGKVKSPKCLTDINEAASDRLHVPDANVDTVPFPQQYRLQLQMINLDS